VLSEQLTGSEKLELPFRNLSAGTGKNHEIFRRRRGITFGCFVHYEAFVSQLEDW
jgi:hypothetical protein